MSKKNGKKIEVEQTWLDPEAGTVLPESMKVVESPVEPEAPAEPESPVEPETAEVPNE